MQQKMFLMSIYFIKQAQYPKETHCEVFVMSKGTVASPERCSGWVRSSGSYLRVRWGQALANVNSEEGVLPEGDVELEELRLAEIEEGSPKHSWGDILGHPPAHLDVPGVYAAVSACPRTWTGERTKKKKTGLFHLSWQAQFNGWLM